MARSISRQSQIYGPNADGSPKLWGPYSVDSFTKADTSGLRWTATVEGWPADAALLLFSVRLQWSDGTWMAWSIYGGRLNPDGTPMTTISNKVDVPRISDGNGGTQKAEVASGTLSLTSYHAVQTAISLSAEK